MKLGNIAKKAKEQVDKRGGVDSLKEDAAELKKIAKSEGKLGDKAKRAAKAVKDPDRGSKASGDKAAGAKSARR